MRLWFRDSSQYQASYYIYIFNLFFYIYRLFFLFFAAGYNTFSSELKLGLLTPHEPPLLSSANKVALKSPTRTQGSE